MNAKLYTPKSETSEIDHALDLWIIETFSDLVQTLKENEKGKTP